MPIDDEALVAAARAVSDRYVTEYRLPDKAIDLIDQAAAKVRLAGGEAPAVASSALAPIARRPRGRGRRRGLRGRRPELKQRDRRSRPARRAPGRATAEVGGEAEVAAVVAARTGIPVGELVAGELERLAELEDDLHRRVIGQDARRRARRRHHPARPRRACPRATARWARSCSSGRPASARPSSSRRSPSGCSRPSSSLVRIDMSEYREPHTVARLIGSPPGYVGYGDGGQLTEPVRRRPYSRRPARRGREGAPRGLERPAPAHGRRPADRRRGPHGRLHERRRGHDVEPRRRQGASAASASPPATPGRPTTERMREAAKARVPARVPQPHRRDRHVPPLTPAQVERIARLICDRVARAAARASAASSWRSTTRSSPGWRARASTRSSAPGRCSATSAARSSGADARAARRAPGGRRHRAGDRRSGRHGPAAVAGSRRGRLTPSAASERARPAPTHD